jgi:hypothetical protein
VKFNTDNGKVLGAIILIILFLLVTIGVSQLYQLRLFKTNKQTKRNTEEKIHRATLPEECI